MHFCTSLLRIGVFTKVVICISCEIKRIREAKYKQFFYIFASRDLHFAFVFFSSEFWLWLHCKQDLCILVPKMPSDGPSL